jgi:hypothetical protein
MKKFNPNLLGLVILMALFAGCVNPVTVIPPANSSADSSFIIDIMIGNESKVPMDMTGTDSGRIIAGPDSSQIKGVSCNIMQLIVVNRAGQIVSFDEARRRSNSETEVELGVNFIPLGETYYFFLLIGHWEHDGNYNYKNESPTLLVAGLQEELVKEYGKISITMWPITVDTKFKSVDPSVPVGSREKEPAINAGKPTAVELHKGNWTVTWTINRETKTGTNNGLADLIRAQSILFPTAKDNLRLKSKKTILRGTRFSDDVGFSADAETGNVITLDMGQYTAGSDRKGESGSVTFSLEYIPFNLRASEQFNPWKKFNSRSEFDLSGTNEPVWIIRNGVNDLPQDSLTNFNTLGDGESNGNGAISFIVPKTGDFVIQIPW